MTKLLEISNILHKKADLLLEKYPFIQLAKKHFGNINFTGSYVFNCMLDADIDINITLNPMDKAKILSFADDLTEIRECRKVILYNRLSEDNPHFIINVERFVFLDETWTITFFIEEMDFQNAIEVSNKLKKDITPEFRAIILKIKDWRIVNNLKSKIPSILIYEAVLEQNVGSVEDFIRIIDFE